MNTNACRHKNLVLLTEPKDRLRCRHCHLTIKSDELRDRYCPECYESKGIKRYNFEKVVAPATQKVQYRCEECGILIQTE